MFKYFNLVNKWLIAFAFLTSLLSVANADFVNRVQVDGSGRFVGSQMPAFTGGDCTTSAGSVALDCSKVKGAASTVRQTQRVMMALTNNNANVNIVVLGDSTGDATNEWVYMLGQSLAAKWPAYTVKYRPWGTVDYPPGSEVTIASGSGSKVLTLWNGSIAGTIANKFAGDNFFAAVININPDLVLMNYGHNGGTSADAQVNYMTATTSRIAREVGSPIIIIGQNPMQSGGVDTGVTKPKNIAYRALAEREGYGFVDVYSAFIQSGVSLSTLVPDGTHPGSQGQTIWRDLVLSQFTYSGTTASGVAQPSQAIRTITSISNYADFVRRAALFGGATLSKNTTDYETWGASTKLSTTSASGWIYFDIATGEDAVALRGKTITVSTRIKVPAGNGVDAGRIELDDGTGSTITSDGGPQGTEFYWHSVTRTISGAATRIRVYLYGASSAVNSEVNIDRLIVGEGPIPQDATPVATTPIQRDIHVRGAGTSGIGSFYNSSGSSYGLRFIPTETTNAGTAWTSEWNGDGLNTKQTGDTYSRVSVSSSGIYFGVGAAAPSMRIAYRFSDALAPNAHWYPNSDAAYDLGANGVAWRNIFVTGDYYVNSNKVIGSDLSITSSYVATSAPSTKTANYTVDSGASKDSSLIFNGAGSLTVTLPTASSFSGRVIRIKTITAQTVVSASSNVVPLAGGAAGTAILAATAGKWADLQSDGSNWIIMAAN
jgi:lysophospholipase L1-like esterase